MDLDLGTVYIPTDYGMVSENHVRIAEIIQDYDAEMFLCFIPADKRMPGDAPFAVIHRPVGKAEYVVFYADECDERILERLWTGDARKQGGHEAILNRIDARNVAIKAVQMKKQMDEMAEQHEKAKAIFRSSKDTYIVDGIKIHASKPHERISSPKVL